MQLQSQTKVGVVQEVVKRVVSSVKDSFALLVIQDIHADMQAKVGKLHGELSNGLH